MTLALFGLLLSVRTVLLPADARSPVTVEAPRGYTTTVILPWVIASLRCTGGHAFGISVQHYRPEGRLLVRPSGHRPEVTCRVLEERASGNVPVMTLRLTVGGEPGDSEVRIVRPGVGDAATATPKAAPVALHHGEIVARHASDTTPAGRAVVPALAVDSVTPVGGAAEPVAPPPAAHPAAPETPVPVKMSGEPPRADETLRLVAHEDDPAEATLADQGDAATEAAASAGASAGNPSSAEAITSPPPASPAPPAEPSSGAAPPSSAVAVPTLLLTVSKEIGRQESLDGQRPVVLERLYEPADLKPDSKLWLEFRQVGGAKSEVLSIAASWGRADSYTARAVGRDLMVRVEVPNALARKKDAWLELDLSGQKYRFKSLTTPTFVNFLKGIMK